MYIVATVTADGTPYYIAYDGGLTYVRKWAARYSKEAAYAVVEQRRGLGWVVLPEGSN